MQYKFIDLNHDIFKTCLISCIQPPTKDVCGWIELVSFCVFRQCAHVSVVKQRKSNCKRTPDKSVRAPLKVPGNMKIEETLPEAMTKMTAMTTTTTTKTTTTTTTMTLKTTTTTNSSSHQGINFSLSTLCHLFLFFL